MPINPLQTCGPQPNSGDLSMLPEYQSVGGSRAYSVYSGTAGGGAVIWSGAGILKTVVTMRRQVSGIATEFVDCGAFVSGLTGFAGSSGMNYLGRVPATYDATAQVSGSTIDTTLAIASPIRYDTPFASGLSFSTASGGNPFTVTFTPLRQPVL